MFRAELGQEGECRGMYVEARNGRAGRGRKVGNKKRWPVKTLFFRHVDSGPCFVWGLATPVAMRLE
jgi:hypothetical protein